MIASMEQTRVCNCCEQEKPLSAFWKRHAKTERRQTFCKACKQAQKNERRKLSPRAAFQTLISNAKRRGTACGVTVDDLLILWGEQKGLCALSGLAMTHGVGLKSTSVSVDRLNQDIGYMKGNIRLVCVALNSLRGPWSDQEALRIARAFVDYQEAL